MTVLLTGATGYIGKRLLPVLIDAGHDVVCMVRDAKRFNPPATLRQHISVVEADLLDEASLERIPRDIDGAFYLVHSMSSSSDFEELERTSATNFRTALERTEVQHVVYLSGIVNEDELSEHLRSRLNVENELAKGSYHLTTLRAGIVIGSGSSSFEIIRDLVEKLPVMVAPRWLETKCQPIAVSDVLAFLSRSLFCPEMYDRNVDIGGTDVLTYKQMLLQFAEIRALDRTIVVVPVMTPRLSSYWLYFVTSTSYKLAVSLVDSMKVEVVCRPSDVNDVLHIRPIGYREALDRAFKKIESNEIVSSWKDSYASSGIDFNVSDFVQVPTHGCFIDRRTRTMDDREACIQKVWSIGGDTGWYHGNWLWRLRGFLDKLVGGVGLRRGRTHPDSISPGDAVDFWRVLYADEDEGRLLLFAEMKLPGEAWLEFRVEGDDLVQTATFRPLGVWGRLYWFAVLPFHGIIFQGLIRKLTTAETSSAALTKRSAPASD